MPNRNVPYFNGLEEYLRGLCEEYSRLGKKKDSDELDLPEVLNLKINDKTPYGTPFRKPPTTYAQQMAVYAERLNVVLSNIGALRNRGVKEDLEKQISDTDKFYKDSLERIDEELKEAKRIEEEMHNRFISAYEMNAPYLQELKEKKLDTPENINEFIPVDKFKAAWDEASKKLCKLQNAKVETEVEYSSKTNRLLEEYKANEQLLQNDWESLFYADAAWNITIDSIENLEQDEAIQNLTEKQLEQAPEKDQMSNFDKYRAQADLSTLKTALLGLERNLEYNSHYKNVDAINDRFEKFEQVVADEFDSEYANVKLDGEEGIYAKLNTEEMKAAASFKQQLANDARKAKEKDEQIAPDNDDYGVVLRTMKADATKLNQLESEKQEIINQIEANARRLSELNLQHEDQKTAIENWKDPDPEPHKDIELKEAQNDIKNAQEKISEHDVLIADQQKKIAEKEKYLNETLPENIKKQQLNLKGEIAQLDKAKEELGNLNKQIEDIDKEDDPAALENEFKDVNLENWTQEYIELSPDDPKDEIASLFENGLKEAQSIGMEIANDRFNIQRLRTRLASLEQFRREAMKDGFKTVDQIEAELNQDVKALNAEKFESEKAELNAEYDGKIEELNAKLNTLVPQKPGEADLESVKKPKIDPASFDADDKNSDDYEENLEEFQDETELYDQNFDGWKALLKEQENKYLEFALAGMSENQKAEETYAKALQTAEETFDKKRVQLEEEYGKIEAGLKAGVDPKEQISFAHDLAGKQELASALNDSREEFIKEQTRAAEEFEEMLAVKLSAMENIHQRQLDEKQEEYRKQLKNVEDEYMLNKLENSEVPKLYDSLSVARAQRAFWKEKIVDPALIKLDETDKKALNDEYQKKVDELEKEINSLSGKIQNEMIARSKDMEQADLQHVGTEVMIQSQLEFLAGQYADERKVYENELRSEFEKNREESLKKFELDQQTKLAEYEDTHFSDATRELAKNIYALEQRKEQEIQSALTQYQDERDNAWRERSDTQRKLAERTDEAFLAEQEAARDEFMKQNDLSGSDHHIIRTAMGTYQRERFAKIRQYVNDLRRDREEERKTYLAQIKNLQDEKARELETLQGKYDDSNKVQPRRSGAVPRDEKLDKLLNQARADLKFNLQKLAELNAEGKTIPSLVNLTEKDLQEANAGLEKANESRYQQFSAGDAENRNNKSLIDSVKMDYSDKGYGEYIGFVEKARSVAKLKELLSGDLEEFKNLGIKDAEGEPISFMDAYREGESYFNLINGRVDEEMLDQKLKLEGMNYESDVQRAKAAKESFFRQERNFLFDASPDVAAKYKLFLSIDQHKDKFVQIAGFNRDDLAMFYKRVSDTAQKAVNKDKKSADEIRIDPAKFLNELGRFEQDNLGTANDVLRGYAFSEYVQKLEKDKKIAKKRDKVIEANIARLKKDLDDPQFLQAIDNVIKYDHDTDPGKREWDREIAFNERKVKIFQRRLNEQKTNVRENADRIIKCKLDIAKNIEDISKYQQYSRGLGRVYENTVKALNKAEERLREDEGIQQTQEEKQIELQTALKNKVGEDKRDLLKQKDNLLKKRRLLKAAIGKISEKVAAETERDTKQMEELNKLEKNALDNYLQYDKDGLVLEELTSYVRTNAAKRSVPETDIIKEGSEKLVSLRAINAKKYKEVSDAILNIEAEIAGLGGKNYDNPGDRRNASDEIEKRNKTLKLNYEEKRRLEDEAAEHMKMENAYTVLELRQKQSEQRALLSTHAPLLDQAQKTLQVVEKEIGQLKNELKMRADIKSENVRTMNEATEKFKKSVEALSDKTEDEKQLEDMRKELVVLQTGEKKQQLDGALKEAQEREQRVIADNLQIDKRNEERKALEGIGGKLYQQAQKALEDKEKEIKQTNDLIKENNSSLDKKNNEIEAEKVNMKLQLQADRKKLGEKMLKLDEYNKLNAQRTKLENFQNRRLVPMFADYKAADVIVAESNSSIENVNIDLKKKMLDIENMADKVKKSKIFFGNSEQFTKMVEAVHKCVEMDVNTDPSVAAANLLEASKRAKEYIAKRETDWVQTSSLLRKHRLAMANDIIRTSVLLGRQYQQLAEDKALNQEKFTRYNVNRNNIAEVKSSENEQTKAYGKLCTVYINPICVSNDDKYSIYRQRDRIFDSYTKNIYTKEWDKVEQRLMNDPKADPKSYVGRNLKFMYKQGFDASRRIMSAQPNEEGIIPETMIEEIYQKNLEHVIRKQADSDVIAYEYEMDKTNYAGINGGEQKIALDKALAEAPQEIKIIVEPKDPASSKSKTHDFDKELKGFPVDENSMQKSREKDDKIINKDEKVINKNDLKKEL